MFKKSLVILTGLLCLAGSLYAEPVKPAAGNLFSEPVNGLKFAPIPAGNFQMGSPEAVETLVVGKQNGDDPGKARWFKNELPLHKVVINKPFYMATTETTVAAFRQFVQETGHVTDMEKTAAAAKPVMASKKVKSDKAAASRQGKWKEPSGSIWNKPGFAQTDSHPVVSVSWNDAQAFVKWLNAKYTDRTFRLPTEAEWEYAAKAGSTTSYYWGAKPDAAYANLGDKTFSTVYPRARFINRNLEDGQVHTAPVASYKPNAWGLYDMSGNVWEWCQDSFALYPGAEKPAREIKGDRKVLRGGSFIRYANDMRSSRRYKANPASGRSNRGFRVVMEEIAPLSAK